MSIGEADTQRDSHRWLCDGRVRPPRRIRVLRAATGPGTIVGGRADAFAFGVARNRDAEGEHRAASGQAAATGCRCRPQSPCGPPGPFSDPEDAGSFSAAIADGQAVAYPAPDAFEDAHRVADTAPDRDRQADPDTDAYAHTEAGVVADTDRVHFGLGGVGLRQRKPVTETNARACPPSSPFTD